MKYFVLRFNLSRRWRVFVVHLLLWFSEWESWGKRERMTVFFFMDDSSSYHSQSQFDFGSLGISSNPKYIFQIQGTFSRLESRSTTLSSNFFMLIHTLIYTLIPSLSDPQPLLSLSFMFYIYIFFPSFGRLPLRALQKDIIHEFCMNFSIVWVLHDLFVTEAFLIYYPFPLLYNCLKKLVIWELDI